VGRHAAVSLYPVPLNGERHRLLGLLFADPQVPRHAVHHDPLRTMGPRRTLGRQVLNGIAKSFDQIRARARFVRVACPTQRPT